jgi:primosomal replication protein N
VAVNSAVLEGTVAKCDAPRTTPGGVATLNLTLTHQSVQQEGNSDVAVELEMNAMAFGDVAKALEGVKVGDKLSLKGFLARKNRFSTVPVLHITQFKFQS